MGVGIFIHHIGTVLLLAATVLLIVASVSSPVVDHLAILKVDLARSNTGNTITFGTFGYCLLGNRGHDACTHAHVGYEPTNVLSQALGFTLSSADRNSTRILTRLLVLHPVAAALSFLAFLLCLGTSIIGSFIGSVFSALAFIVTIIALAADFATFAIIKHAVNNHRSTTTVVRARWGPVVWCVVAAAAFTLVSTLLVFVTCCAGRRKSRRGKATGY